MGTATMETAIKAVTLGEAVISAIKEYDAEDFTDLHIAVETGAITKASIATETKVSASTVGYHALAWMAMACGDDKGVATNSDLLSLAVTIHRTKGIGVAEAKALLATANTRLAALNKMKAYVKGAGGDDRTVSEKLGGARKPKAAKKNTEVMATAITSLGDLVKNWDGTVTAVQASVLAELAATIVAKTTTVATAATPAAVSA